MKFRFDKRYLKLCRYIAATTIIIYLAFRLIDSVPFLYDNILLFFDNMWDISFPIIVGFIIAFLMFGPSNAIEKGMLKIKFFSKHKSLCRATGIIVSYIAVLGFLIALLCGVYFMVGGQISQNSTINNILTTITDYFDNNTLSTDSIRELVEKFNLPFGDLITSQMDNIALFLQGILANLFNGLTTFIFNLGSNIFSLVISVTFSIYVLASHEYFEALWDKFFFIIFRKRKEGVVIRRSLHIINVTFSKYIHGQLIEASIVAVLSSIVLTIIGMDYAIIIGVICGVFNLIPYIGPFIGIAIAAVLALFSGDIWMSVAIIIGLMIVQQIDCNFLCPKIVGDVVGLHPALVLIAVTIGGNWYGLLGMIIAVPVVASVKTLVSDWYEHYVKEQYEAYKKNEAKEIKNDGKIFSELKKSKEDVKES